MEIKDFRKLAEKSAFKDKLSKLEITIFLDHLNSKIELKGVQSIYKFVYDQVIGWNKVKSLPSYFLMSKIHFEHLKSLLINITSYDDLSYQFNFEQDLLNLQKVLIKNKNNSNDYIFIYDAPETDFLISVHEKDISLFNGAIDYITKSNKNHSNDINYFTGSIYAYEFAHQGNSEILQRRNSERLTLNQIRSKFNDYMVEAEQQLNANIVDAKENLTNHFETVDKLKHEKSTNFEEWFTGIQTGFDRFFINANETVSTNEDLYKEKLRLEAPAKYWKDRATKLVNRQQKVD